MPGAAYVKDVAGRYLFVNAAAARVLARPVAEILGRDDVELFGVETAALFRETDRRVLETGEVVSGVQCATVGGVDYTTETTKGPLRDAGGRVVGVVGVSRDITEFVRQQQARQRSEAQYRLLADNASDCISRHDMEGRYLYASPSCRKLNGYEPEELVGRSPLELVHPDDMPRAIEALAAALDPSAEVHTVEVRVRHKDERWVWVETSAHLVQAESGKEIHCATRDVTARREAEAEVRRSEALLRSFYESAPLSLLVVELVDGEPMIVSANAATAATHERDPAELRGLRLRDLGHPSSGDGHPPWSERFAEALTSGASVRFDYGHDFGTEPRWFTVTIRHIEGSCVTAPRFAVVVQDISKRRRAEEALRASEERFRLLAENAHDLITLTDADGRILYASPSCHAQLGYEPAEFLGHDGREFIYPDDLPTLVAASSRPDAQRASDRLTYRVRRKDGSHIWVESSIILTFDPQTGRFLQAQTTSRDVTERRAAAEALRESEQQLATVIDAGALGFWDWDVATSHVFYSGHWAGMLGYAQEEIEPHVRSWERLLHPDDQVRVWPQIEAHLAGKTPVLSLEFQMRRKDGSWAWILSRGRVVERDADGRPIRALGVHSDMTERKRAEQEREQLTARLGNLRRIEQAILTGHSPEEIARAALPPLRQSTSCWMMDILGPGETPESWVVLATDGEAVREYPPGSQFQAEEIGRNDIEALRAGADVAVDDVAVLSDLSLTVRALRGMGMRSYVRVPLAARGALVGSMSLYSDRPGPFDPEAVAVAHEAADSLAVAIRHARLFQELGSARRRLEQLSHRLIRTQEEERRSVAREVHDEIGQALLALKLSLTMAERDPASEASARGLKESLGLVERLIGQVRELLRGLWPSVLDDLGLVPALRSFLTDLGARSGFEVTLDVGSKAFGRVGREVETACFRIVQEALTNVVRHASARRAIVVLRRDEVELRLSVTDDGVGFDRARAEALARRGVGLGLPGMQERAALAGGRLWIKSDVGRGTSVRAVFPIRPALAGSPPGPPGS
jgi:PAS domain S-box-containing protein